MARSSLMINLDDPRTAKIAEVMANETCKKILSALAEKEMTESEIASVLNLPLNTVGYNTKKLVDAGLIETEKKFLWSVKGKRIHRYRVSNKRIVITPKQMMRGVLPALIATGLAAFGIKLWTSARVASNNIVAQGEQAFTQVTQTVAKDAASAGVSAPASETSAAQGIIETCSQGILSIAQNAWLWFVVGALTALFVYLVWNFARRR